MGVSGGGGEPRCALTVDVDAVELSRLTPPGFGIVSSALSPGWRGCEDEAEGMFAFGGGQYCWEGVYGGLAALALWRQLEESLLVGGFWAGRVW
jgi:hypothetical protein